MLTKKVENTSTQSNQVKVTGAFVDGKLQLCNIKSAGVDANSSFVAVNAPFIPGKSV